MQHGSLELAKLSSALSCMVALVGILVLAMVVMWFGHWLFGGQSENQGSCSAKTYSLYDQVVSAELANLERLRQKLEKATRYGNTVSRDLANEVVGGLALSADRLHPVPWLMFSNSERENIEERLKLVEAELHKINALLDKIPEKSIR